MDVSSVCWNMVWDAASTGRPSVGGVGGSGDPSTTEGGSGDPSTTGKTRPQQGEGEDVCAKSAVDGGFE